MHRVGLFIVVMTLFISCQNKVIFNEYQSLENTKWESGEVVAIEIPIQDNLSHHNLYINIRNNADYAYSNIYLIARMTFPDHKQITDTLEYEMTDTHGKFLGSGFSDIKENKLFYKENIRFPKQGTYVFEVKQAMRKRNQITPIDPLKGVMDVGISVEKVNQ